MEDQSRNLALVEVDIGFFIRKSVRFGPLRLNLSKSGLGVSGGVRGFRIGTGPRGSYIHAGRGGLYYRQTLPAPKRAARTKVSPVGGAPEAPRASVPEFEEIDSGDVFAMADSSASNLLDEINKKQRAVRYWPLIVVTLVGLWFLVERGEYSEIAAAWLQSTLFAIGIEDVAVSAKTLRLAALAARVRS